MSKATARHEPGGESRGTSAVDVCAAAQSQMDAGDPRAAQRTLVPVVRAMPFDPLPFRLLGEAFLRSGDAQRAERALAHARNLELARIDRGEEAIDRGTEAWLHRARSLKKTQTMLGYQAVADAVAQSAPPASSASGVREKVVDAPLDDEDGVALDVRLNHERRRARALEAQPTRRIEPPSELLELAAPKPKPEPEPIAEASEEEIEVLVEGFEEAQVQAHPQPQAPPQGHDERFVQYLTLGACLMLAASIVALLLALGFFR